MHLRAVTQDRAGGRVGRNAIGGDAGLTPKNLRDILRRKYGLHVDDACLGDEA